MTTLNWVLFGMMLAWTPALLVLAILLWRESGINEDHT